MGLVKLTDERKQKFLTVYADLGRLNEAARAVDLCPETIRVARKEDDEFSAAVAEAYRDFCDTLEKEAYRRAVEGWEEPVFQGGVLVGTVLKRSDRILELMLKRHIPEYRDRQTVDMNLSGGVLVVPGIPVSPDEWEEQHGQRRSGSPVDEASGPELLSGSTREIGDSSAD